jgi:hypothetical protein
MCERYKVSVELGELGRLQAVAAWATTIVRSGRAGDDTTATFIGELARALESTPEGDLVVASMAELDEWRAELEQLRADRARLQKLCDKTALAAANRALRATS